MPIFGSKSKSINNFNVSTINTFMFAYDQNAKKNKTRSNNVLYKTQSILSLGQNN